MTASEDEMINTLKARAGRVIEMHRAHGAAIADQQTAEDELLARVVDAVRAALPALSGRVDDIPDALRIGTRQNGDKEIKLYLTEHAHWYEIVCHANGGVGIAELTLGAVLENWSVHFIVLRIAEALESQERGKLATRTEQIGGRAARMRALATLLEREV